MVQNYIKLLRKASMEFKDIPWKDVLLDAKGFVVFKDGYPVTEGHILFVPKV